MNKLFFITALFVLFINTLSFAVNKDGAKIPNITINAYDAYSGRNPGLEPFQVKSWTFKPYDFTITRIYDPPTMPGGNGNMVLTGIVSGKKYHCVIRGDYSELLQLHQSMMLMGGGELNCQGKIFTMTEDNSTVISVGLRQRDDYEIIETVQLVSNSKSALDVYKLMIREDIIERAREQHQKPNLKDIDRKKLR